MFTSLVSQLVDLLGLLCSAPSGCLSCLTKALCLGLSVLLELLYSASSGLLKDRKIVFSYLELLILREKWRVMTPIDTEGRWSSA